MTRGSDVTQDIENDGDELQRLRRQLRAVTSVNRQLQAQVTGAGASTGKRRREGPADNWLAMLRSGRPETAATLVGAPDGTLHVVESGVRRRVKVKLLALALERHLGPRRAIGDDELAQLIEGPPVELLEANTGPPFLFVGGQMLPVRGVPLTYPVSQDWLDGLATGPELDLLAGIRTTSRASTGGAWPTRTSCRSRGRAWPDA